MYFKTPRNVQIFGVNVEAMPTQINYLLDTDETIGENRKKNSHGPNTVVSLFHHFFEQHGIGEKKGFCHCDNCGGQNKNKTVIAYIGLVNTNRTAQQGAVEFYDSLPHAVSS